MPSSPMVFLDVGFGNVFPLMSRLACVLSDVRWPAGEAIVEACRRVRRFRELVYQRGLQAEALRSALLDDGAHRATDRYGLSRDHRVGSGGGAALASRT